MKAPAQTHVLAVEEVSKAFGPVAAVDRVSFEVRPGEIFGFLGPNGAGKTTTLRMIMGITAPDSGIVRFEGRERIDRRRVGYLPEERGLFEDASVVETLGYLGALHGLSLGAARSAALGLLERMDLAARARDRVSTLSKGNQQKVQLIAAILHRPALIVLDEPFSGLDPINQEMFLDLLRELRGEGRAILLSAHQLDLVERLADRFLLLSHGSEVVAGSLAEIRDRTTGGRDTVLSLELSPTGAAGGADGAAALREALEAEVPEAGIEIRGAAEGALRLDLLLASDAGLSPILALISRRAQVRRIETRRLSLHEIYLQAVRQAGGSGHA